MKQLKDESRRRFFKYSSMLGMTVAFSPGTIIEAFAGFFDARGVKLPVAVSAFGEEIYQHRRAGQRKLM